MRSLFKLSLAALVATFFAAGLALAQDDKPEMKITLGVRGAFGQLTQSTAVNQDTDPKSEKDKSTTSEAGWKNEGQTDLTFLYTTSKVTAKAFYRFREDSGNAAGQAAAVSPLTSLRSDIYWKATDMVSLGFMNRSTGGLPGSAVAYGTYGGTITGGSGMAAGGTVGPVGFFSDVNGIDVRVGSGTNTFGLLVLDNCVPACGYKTTTVATFNDEAIDPTLDADATAEATTLSLDFTGTKADSSYVLYYSGAFGDLKLGAYYTTASAKMAGTDTKSGGLFLGNGSAGTVKDLDKYGATSTLLDVNLSYALGATGLAFEFWNQAQSCVTKLADGCSVKGTTGIVLGVNVPAGAGTLRAHFVSLSDTATLAEDWTQANATTDILVEFAIPMTAQFKLVPLFATRTTVTTEKLKDSYAADKTVSANFVALGGKADF